MVVNRLQRSKNCLSIIDNCHLKFFKKILMKSFTNDLLFHLLVHLLVHDLVVHLLMKSNFIFGRKEKIPPRTVS